MLKNISISTFINIIFSLAFVAIMITFTIFISFDKQRHEITLQNRYELIAENFLSTFQNFPTIEALEKLFKKFKVEPIKEREKKLEIIKQAQEPIKLEDHESDKLWVIHQLLYESDTDQVQLDWEATEYQWVTAEEIKAAAAKVFVERRSVVGKLLPEEK